MAVLVVLFVAVAVNAYFFYAYHLPRLSPAPIKDPVLMGAGDIASCSSTGDEATAKLLDSISGTVFTAGDNAYDSGTSAEFSNYYQPTWGRHKARTKPVPGNHEYQTPGASGYFGYFFGGNVVQYYSYNLGNWHTVALDSNIARDASSPQVTWLKNDLAQDTHPCEVAYFHHPLFSSGEHGNDTSQRAIWDALYAAGVDVVINGHDHDYERFALQRPDGTPDTTGGIREFVVGTGGKDLRPFSSIKANSEVRNSTDHGVLKMTLHPNSYDWQFIPIAGKSFTDSGSDTCHQ
jgi:acid phosphatase type 7